MTELIMKLPLVSSKGSFNTIMALVEHFNLELPQIVCEHTTFLNGDIQEEV